MAAPKICRSLLASGGAGGGENLTAVLYGINDLRLENRPIPEPADDELQMKMDVVGICGSDVHYMTHGKIGQFVMTGPMVIGHEAAGVVSKVGKNVKDFKEGDRVAIEPGTPCRICNYCKEGRYNLCLGMVFCATPPYDGNLARYYVHPADFCYKLPDHVSLEEGALLEPLSVGVHACKRAKVTIGSIVLILGAGPIGLVTLVCAKAFGASKVCITDIVDYRLNKAKEMGADKTIQVNKEDKDEDLAQKVECTLGSRPCISIDCCGTEQTVRTAIKATLSGGTVVIVGMGQDEMTVPMSDALIREVDLRGIFRYCNDYETSLELVQSGKVNVKPLVTHHFKIEESVKAFETAKTGEGNPIKILIHTAPDWKP